MPKCIPEVDAYIKSAPEYSRPILKHLRKLFHEASPKIEETIKWGMPHFEYLGIVGMMAAFKQHVAFGFWKGKLLSDPHGLLKGDSTSPFTTKIKSLADLPDDEILLTYMREAVALNEQGVKLEKSPAKKKPKAKVPDDLRNALAKHPKSSKTFENLSPSHQREYIEWLTEAKQQATRDRRLATTLEWLAEGKPRNWKYMK